MKIIGESPKRLLSHRYYETRYYVQKIIRSVCRVNKNSASTDLVVE